MLHICFVTSSMLCLLYVVVYAITSIMCITSFVRASTLNPGSLHISHQPQG